MTPGEISMPMGLPGSKAETSRVCIPAYIEGGLALHPAYRERGWVVAHANSGMRVAHAKTRDEAETALRELLPALRWEMPYKPGDPNPWTDEERARVSETVNRLGVHPAMFDDDGYPDDVEVLAGMERES